MNKIPFKTHKNIHRIHFILFSAVLVLIIDKIDLKSIFERIFVSPVFAKKLKWMKSFLWYSVIFYLQKKYKNCMRFCNKTPTFRGFFRV